MECTCGEERRMTITLQRHGHWSGPRTTPLAVEVPEVQTMGGLDLDHDGDGIPGAAQAVSGSPDAVVLRSAAGAVDTIATPGQPMTPARFRLTLEALPGDAPADVRL